MTPDEEIRRGNDAARLLADPLLVSAFTDIEAGIVDAMKRTKAADTVTQHELVLMLQLHARVRGLLHEHVTTGRMAAVQKQNLAQKMKDRLMRRVR